MLRAVFLFQQGLNEEGEPLTDEQKSDLAKRYRAIAQWKDGLPEAKQARNLWKLLMRMRNSMEDAQDRVRPIMVTDSSCAWLSVAPSYVCPR